MTQQLQVLKKTLDNRQSIEAKIENLKKQLKIITKDYYKEAYRILKEILRLRNIQYNLNSNSTKKVLGGAGKTRGFTSLFKENGLEMTRHHIYYIFLQDYFSPKSKQLIEEEKLKTSSLLGIIKRDVRYRTFSNQDKIVDRLIKKEISVQEVQFTPFDVIMSGKNKKNATYLANLSLYKSYARVENTLKSVRAKSNLFSNKNAVLNLMRATERLYKECEQILKFGKNMKK